MEWDRERVPCPAGHQSAWWRQYGGRDGGRDGGRRSPPRDPFIKGHFPRRTCQACALRARCVGAPGAGQRTGRQLVLHPRAAPEALTAARARFAPPRRGVAEGRTAYAAPSGIEGPVSPAVRAFGLRRARYRGLAKTHVQAVATAAALNFARLDAWLAAYFGDADQSFRSKAITQFAPSRSGVSLEADHHGRA